MVVKLFCRKQSNFFTVLANSILKRTRCSATSSSINDYKYLLILDFEATCEKKKKLLQEIIEFPCLKVNCHTLKEESRFHHYVRPIFAPTLSHFCIELTGILQEMVDKSPTFPEVYKLFEEWREKEGLTESNSLYVTSGDWDLGHMIKFQCKLCDIPKPAHMNIWADLKKLKCSQEGCKRWGRALVGISCARGNNVFANNESKICHSFFDILRYYEMDFEGRQHSGIDDCLNMLRVIQKMGSKGITIKPTSVVHTETLKVLTINQPLHPVKLLDTSLGPAVK